ncbi:hypothetical protein ZIOFF_013438 [Zingiber officinale]|uniref:TRF2/HOY1 PH-like domain-containing protein n=1 Tax=Zingiber officinale TaxID=94328 RepID=A0A8J5LKV9_ZINOF|nr:hypothetical protein ZIOFF_013438 [Zingiber officinale]
MVWTSNSDKRRADSTQYSASPPPTVKLEVEEPLDEKRVRLHKRVRDASTSCEQALYNNVLREPGPLGLYPRKSRSLADMIQMMLSQAKAGKTICFTSSKGSEVGEQSDFSASSSSLSKIKASNFPTSLLSIRTWECVSRYEGDLEAKCYFTKHKHSSAATNEQSIISRGNSLCCLLQQNTVSGMVWSSNSNKHRADSTQHLAPPPTTVKLEVEEPLNEKRVCLHKRVRDASTSCEHALYNNVLGELGPLGLYPRKSWSLADMIQIMLS